MYIVSKSRVWRPFSNELFEGWAPLPMPEGSEYMHWRGGKISVALWQTILAFFLGHRTDEVQVRLYYNTATRQWGAHAFPQRYPTSMSTKELEDHPNMAVDLQLFPSPWAYMGTVHHHCGMAAFQSGTDHSNEAGIIGLHITVGKLNEAILDLHTRVCMKFPGELDAQGNVVRAGVQQFYEDVALSNWFELPAPVAAVLPVQMHESILTTLLKTPVGKEVGFPTRWAENLIRFCGAPQTYWREWPEAYGDGFSDWRPRDHGGEPAFRGGVAHSPGGRLKVTPRNHLAPRGSQKPAGAAETVKKGSKGSALPHAAAIGMRDDEHQWLLETILALMDPVFPPGRARAPVGNHLDLEQAWTILEFTSIEEARTGLDKMGFKKTIAGYWCHPEELNAINKAVLDCINEAEKTPATPQV